jgi:hypothetical protein
MGTTFWPGNLFGRLRWECSIKTDHKEVVCEEGRGMEPAQDHIQL